MHARTFAVLLDQLAKLSPRQRAKVIELLRQASALESTVNVIEAAAASTLACPRCASASVLRHGRSHDLQRFRCKGCGKTFNSLTGTPLARLRHKARWLDYLTSMLDPATTVRRAAKVAEVHKNTSFRWRHRFLTLTSHDRPASLRGIAEADEMFLLESQKGARTLNRPARKRGGHASRRGISYEQICILVARDRAGQTHDFVTGAGPLTAGKLNACLPAVLDEDVLLVTDGNPVYRQFAHQTGIAHEAVNLRAGVRVRGAIHVQNVNAYHSRFRGWLRHFHGVATRYLGNYLGWRWAVDGARIAHAEQLLQAATGHFHT